MTNLRVLTLIIGILRYWFKKFLKLKKEIIAERTRKHYKLHNKNKYIKEG